MSTANLWRLAGVSAILGGVGFAVADVLSLIGSAGIGEDDIVQWGLLAVASAFGLGGLVGVYAIQARESGMLGLIGFLSSFAALLLVFGFAWGGVVIIPEILDTAFVQQGPERTLAAVIIRLRLPVLAIGFLLLAVATLRARVLSRVGAWVLVAGALTGAVSALGIVNLLDPIGEATLGGIGFGWLGASLVRVAGRRRVAE